jgi:acyl-CoA thioesterase
MNQRTINLEEARQAFEIAAKEHSQEFELFFLSKLFGLDYSYTDNTCEIAFEPKNFMFNPQGSLHGGVITTIMDISMGHLLKKMQGAGVTLEIKVQFIKSLKLGKCKCVGKILKRGRSVAFMVSELFDEDGELCAVASSTWKIIDN